MFLSRGRQLLIVLVALRSQDVGENRHLRPLVSEIVNS